jgi:hypothetical protein
LIESSRGTIKKWENRVYSMARACFCLSVELAKQVNLKTTGSRPCPFLIESPRGTIKKWENRVYSMARACFCLSVELAKQVNLKTTGSRSVIAIIHED